MLIKIESQESQRVTGIITNSGEKMHFLVCFKAFQYELTVAADSLMTNVLYRGRVGGIDLEEIEKAINWFIKMDTMASQLYKPVGVLYAVKWANKSQYFTDSKDANRFKTILTSVNGLASDEVKIETIDLY